jgi:hypothetical protein
MGKRSDFEHLDKSQYLTPEAAFMPLVPFLPKGGFLFAEPCAGDGRLANYVEQNTHGAAKLLSDIDPDGARKTADLMFGGHQREDILHGDALDITNRDLNGIDMVITNPPWERQKKHDYILHKLIEHFASKIQTWFLFDSDWPHTVQAKPFLDQYCTRIVSIGRVKWLPDTNQTGKDNAAWYEFRPDARRNSRAPAFYGRGIAP